MSRVVHKVLLPDRELFRRVVDGSRIVQKSRPSLRFVEGSVELFIVVSLESRVDYL